MTKHLLWLFLLTGCTGEKFCENVKSTYEFIGSSTKVACNYNGFINPKAKFGPGQCASAIDVLFEIQPETKRRVATSCRISASAVKVWDLDGDNYTVEFFSGGSMRTVNVNDFDKEFVATTCKNFYRGTSR